MPLKDGDPLDYWGNKTPKCPHCDANYDISYHEQYSLYDTDEGEHEIECPSCERTYTVRVRCEFTFHTDEQPEDDEAKP